MAFNVIETLTEFDYENGDPTRNEEWAAVAVVEIGTRKSKSTRIDLRRMYVDDDGNERPGKGFTFRSTEEMEHLLTALNDGLEKWKTIEAEAAAEAEEVPAKPAPRRRRKATAA